MKRSVKKTVQVQSYVARHGLVEARRQRGMTQKELALAVGTSYVNISRWERGETNPGPYYQKKLIELFAVAAEQLNLVVARPAETTAETEIQMSAPIPPPKMPHEELIGREDDLYRLRQLVTRHSLVTVCGLPGVGKTALVAALARDQMIRKQFPDGILWTGLGAHPHKSTFRMWGQRLGLTDSDLAELTTPDPWGAALRTAIGSRRMLLIIDDAWSSQAALMFKVGGPNCAHLLTTRFPALATSIASSPHAVVSLDSLNEEQSILLLRMLAPDVVTTGALESIRQIIRQVGGLPLALQLIGKYLRKEGRNHQPRRVKAALERLQHVEVRLNLAQDASDEISGDSSVSLSSLLALSDAHLSSQARAAFYALAALPAKPAAFSEEAALSVADCSTSELDELADAGILEVRNSGSHYTLHQVIADYARMQFAKQPAERTSAVYHRLVTYTLTFVTSHEEDYDLLAEECHLYTAALDVADAHGYFLLYVQLMASLATYVRACLVYGAESYLKRAIELAQSMESELIYPDLIKILKERIRLRLHRRDYTTAHDLAELGLRRAQDADDKETLRLFTEFLNHEELRLIGRVQSRPECAGTPFEPLSV
jgi:transcriptional regulator with XRE-family HTH domain